MPTHNHLSRDASDGRRPAAGIGRRRLLVVATAASAALVLAACGPSGGTPKPPAGKTATPVSAPGNAAKAATIFTGIVPGVAVGGYDPVAYFTDSKPVVGKPDITLEHQGATWRFASAANRDAFRANPAKFAPQYGGHCAWAVSQGYTAKGDPGIWSITNGKLYLNFNQGVQRSWNQDVPGNIKKADANWPSVVTK